MAQPHTPMTVVDALEQGSTDSRRGFAFIGDDRAETFVSFAGLRDSVARAAAVLADRGIVGGDRVALIVPDAKEFVTGFLAVMWAGAIPVPLYPPVGFGKQDSYLEYIATLMNSVGVTGLVVPQWLDEALELGERFRARLSAVAPADALDTGNDLLDPAARGADQTAFLQFTSGSTGKPKAVVVKDRALWVNIESFVSTLGCNDEDHIVSWLPLYHDMGLVGKMLAPLMFSLNTTFLPTLGFLRDPGSWLDTISAKRGSMSFAPNFAYALAAKKAQPPETGWDLSSMRVFGCAAEPINADTLDMFIERFAPHGLRPEAVVPGYGMAEATLGITLDRLDRRFRRLSAAADAYHAGGVVHSPADGAAALTFVSSGRVFADGHALRIVDDAGHELPAGRVGDVQFRGPSLAMGYFGDAEATSSAFLPDGWLATGDRGFIHDGDLFITGRRKDILIVNGRNYDPHHVEWAAADVPGIRKGNVVAFSVPGELTEDIVVAAERNSADPDHDQQVRRIIWTRTRLAVAEVVFLDPGQLPKTSSGKVQRSRTRDLYLRGELRESAVATRTHTHTAKV
ncbi:fatty acyl-AMP ligase [Mycobacterium vicinigordonae]|uniref:Fatty acyl-AMP ligase n=1 Tax=Mycobacterium vicinigordonae TaxID=1719132 RepID=A0A7D6DZJ7_9MYCO|nr:fatty acyl-AMP ligase [Mycobacterium vicinigordonae]QLL08544.1 fatty acyl-AMP ligase [Mycobacterium vicinigordonae]